MYNTIIRFIIFILYVKERSVKSEKSVKSILKKAVFPLSFMSEKNVETFFIEN